MTCLLILFVLFAFFSMVWSTLYYGIGPVATSPSVKKALFSLLPSHCTGKIYELGAGFGSLVFSLADKYPHATIVAVEVSLIPWCVLHMKKMLFQKNNVKIVRKNFFHLPLASAEMIVCYLFPEAMDKLEKKLTQEGVQALLFTHTFALPRHTPLKVHRASDLYHTFVYAYDLTSDPNTLGKSATALIPKC